MSRKLFTAAAFFGLVVAAAALSAIDIAVQIFALNLEYLGKYVPGLSLAWDVYEIRGRWHAKPFFARHEL